MKNTITEALGRGKSVELNLDTGTLTLLDSERGVELEAAEVLALEMFLCSHGKVYLPFAFAQVAAFAE
ncbi:MAG TPA: hypothetical protein VEL69_02385 [Ktedonobacteraceae bacterium]|nr:hypothetical protein [Ktedonobacteraceae bacterium]